MLYELDKWRGDKSKRDVIASQWIARLDRQLTDSEIDEMLAWARADQGNEISLLKLARLWDQMDALTHLAEKIPRK